MASSPAPSSISQNEDSIVLVCAADEHYALPLGVTIHSVLDSFKGNGSLEIFVLDGGITRESRARIERVVDSSEALTDRVDLQWVPLNPDALKNLPSHHWITEVTYARLLIPQVLPEDYERAIYLDSDLMVKKSLHNLWEHEFSGNAVLAVQGFGTPYVSSPMGVKRYRELGLDPDLPYFNAGVLVLNLTKWRREDIAQEIFAYLKNYSDDIHLVDQDGLNAILARRWGRLGFKWNVASTLLDFDSWEEGPFKKRIGSIKNDLLQDPYVVHFVGESKPWQIGCRHPSQLEWISCLWDSGWFTPSEAVVWFGEWFLRYYWWHVKKRLGII